MNKDYGDMYQYILESKKAVRNIISNHEEIFHDAIEYFFNGNYEQIYVIGSGTSYHAALAAKNLMEKVLQMKVFASYPIVFKDERIFNKNTLVMGLSHAGMSASTIAGLDKAKANALFIVPSLSVESGKTKDANAIIKKLALKDALIVKDLLDEKTLLAFRNLAHCYVVDISEVNAYLISVFNAVIIEKSAYESIIKG